MKTVQEALERAAALRHMHDSSGFDRHRVRRILNGGKDAVAALLGEKAAADDVPIVNMMLSGLDALAHKIGHVPEPRVDVPAEAEDSDRVFKHAEKRERIVSAYDEQDRVELQAPQVARWLPGYSFCVWVIKTRLSPEGIPYPSAELRNPYNAYPGEWGVHQQPAELATYLRVPLPQLRRLYGDKVADRVNQVHGTHRRASGGGVILGQGEWENQSGRGVTVVEYMDADGTHMLIPSIGTRVRFDPNPLESGPAFVIPKRFAFDRLASHYEHIVSLMVMMSKLNALSLLALEDAVFAPTNVYGELSGQYKIGRDEVNVFPPGTKVEHPNKNIPYQMFEAINRVERQIRMMAGYPVTDDAQSPMSFVTGAGMEQVMASSSNEVREYQKVVKWAFQDLDEKRLEWDEKVSPNRKKPLVGQRKGQAFVESYTPRTHIKGNYRTRRMYGMMSGWDDSAKIVGGLQLLSASVIDRTTMQENIDGLDNLSKINERIDDDAAKLALREALLAAAQQGDPRAVLALIEMLPPGQFKDAISAFFNPEEPEPGLGQDPLADLMGGGGGPPAVPTVLSRMMAGGDVDAGAQLVSQV